MKDCLEGAVWIVGMLLVALVLISPVACSMHQDRLVAGLIKAGVSPAAAKCAIKGEDHWRTNLCLSLPEGGPK